LVAVILSATQALEPRASADSATKASCDRVKNVQFPAVDHPDGVVRQRLQGCGSEGLFYGIGQPRDPEKARLCAYVERGAGDEQVFGGSTILMTIYATGLGAARNLDLAIRLACEMEGAPAELEGRVAHLEKLKNAGGTKVDFDICDDVTSGFMMGHCAAHDQRMSGTRRDQGYRARFRGWTAPERAAFQKLRAAAADYFKARSSNEVDRSGTARAAQQIEEEEKLEATFAALLDELERGALAPATAADLDELDRKLNLVYQRVVKAATPQGGTITTDGIRETERRWPRYRDAWTAFAKITFPKADPRAVKARLTRERTNLLNAFDGGPP
jgi:hypothetical protein